MDTQHARPGDIIEISLNTDGYYRRRVTVIERPPGKLWDNRDDAWFIDDNGIQKYFRADCYRIVKKDTQIPEIPFSELKKIASSNHLVKQLLCLKRCFGSIASLGIVTSPSKVDKCKTVAELVSRGHVPGGFEWIDPFLLSLPTVYEIPSDDFMVIPNRYSDGGPPCPWEEARREQEAAKIRAKQHRRCVTGEIEMSDADRIKALQAELEALKRKESSKYHSPDDDPTIVYVMIEISDDYAPAPKERFLRWTVSSTLAGCHDKWRNRDTFMEKGERKVRVIKARLTEVETINASNDSEEIK